VIWFSNFSTVSPFSSSVLKKAAVTCPPFFRPTRQGELQFARRPNPSAMRETTRVFKLTPSFSALAASLA
jgi:hypothetical protein